MALRANGQMARETKRVGIVGLGLIGGSLGLDLQADGWDVQGLVIVQRRLNGRKSAVWCRM
jgi:prephenate dehydrogenase